MYEDREIAVTTPFSPEDLRFAFLEGEDEVSAPFLFHLGLLSENYEIAAEDILGKAFCVRVGMRDDMRYFHGLAAEFRLERFESGFAVYVVVLRPWLWFLTNSTDNRIFQKSQHNRDHRRGIFGISSSKTRETPAG